MLLCVEGEPGRWDTVLTQNFGAFLFVFSKYLYVGFLKYLCIYYLLWHVWSLVVLCEILFPGQGLKLGPLHWEHRGSATGPPEKSLGTGFGLNWMPTNSFDPLYKRDSSPPPGWLSTDKSPAAGKGKEARNLLWGWPLSGHNSQSKPQPLKEGTAETSEWKGAN